MTRITFTLLAAAAIAGCNSESYLVRQYSPDRADFTDQALPNPPEAQPIVNVDPTGPTLPGVEVQPVITGTWEFTTPTTTTRVNRVTDQTSQYSIYFGRPAPTDKPFVVITVTPETLSQAESDPSQYTISGTRNYVLNGNIAHEITGHTSTGAAFAEIVLTHPGAKGDACHAMAIARNDEQRQLALQILASIIWKPNTTNQRSQLDEFRSVPSATRTTRQAWGFKLQPDGTLKCEQLSESELSQVSLNH